MEEKKIKVSELKVSDDIKKVLTLLYNPMSIPQIAAVLDVSYSTANQTLRIWAAKGYVVRIATHGKHLYKLNTATMEI